MILRKLGKLFGVLSLLSTMGSPAAFAQNCGNSFLGTKTLYAAPKVKYQSVPVGYHAVFINHVGRHGARHLTKEVNTSFAYGVLMKADSANALTATGKQLKQMVLALDKVEKGNVKSISVEGKNELQGIGERMSGQYKSIFKDSINLNIGFTKEIRTKQSADAFLTGLKKGFKNDPVVTEYNDDTNLRFYDLSPAYNKFEEGGVWTKRRSALARSVKLESVNRAIIQRFFTTVFLQTLNISAQEKFVNDIYGFAAIIFSLKEEVSKAGLKPVDIAFNSFFTCNELKAMAKVDVADDYYVKGPGLDVNGIQVRIAAPLLANFITTSDEFIKTGRPTAQLRFAHAETIAPFAAILGISIASTPTKDATKIEQAWRSSIVIPLSANIQWIFYKKDNSDQYLVKILLNEKEARINGMHYTGSSYYKWNDLRKLYLKKLQSLHVNLDDDMKVYLQNVTE